MSADIMGQLLVCHLPAGLILLLKTLFYLVKKSMLTGPFVVALECVVLDRL